MNEEAAEIHLELGRLLGIDELVLVEESYVAQKQLGQTLAYLGNVKSADVAAVIRIYDERHELIGIAVRDKELGFWIIFTDLIADGVTRAEFERLADKIAGDHERVVELTREQFREGVIEYYAVGLVNRLFCDCAISEESFYPRERVEILKHVIQAFLAEQGLATGRQLKALEIGCGNGGATIALHELGISLIAVDVNRCELCKGLEEGVLDPKRSIVMDGSQLSSFFGQEFEVVFGFMVGKLTPFERFNWEKVLRELPKVLTSRGKVLLTVSSEEEARILEELLNDTFEAVVRENRESRGYFDQWVYQGALKS
jgi:SAM-dependent methyltransferase